MWLPSSKPREYPSFFSAVTKVAGLEMTTIAFGVFVGCFAIVVLYWFEKLWVLARRLISLL